MRKAFFFSFVGVIFLFISSCQNHPQNGAKKFVQENVEFAARQYGLQTDRIETSGEVLNPRTYIDGEIKYVRPQAWTSAFFPVSMWYLYELTGEEKWKNYGRKYTEVLDTVKYLTWHHDVEFMIGCSYGNGFRLTGDEAYEEVMIQAVRSLSTRFRPAAGIIRSWNVTGDWQAERGWECPVIIDNMMNLELLFDATELSGDSSFYNIAVTHADNTIRHHFRPDYGTWHVVDYSLLEDGSVRNKHTAQGYAHEFTWARGQSWVICGFTVCYRETGDSKYLEQAQKAFEFVAGHPNLPDDGIPYWDYNAPDIPDALRDASSAAIMASALYELSIFSDYDDYKGWADKIMESLAESKIPGRGGRKRLLSAETLRGKYPS